MPWFSKRLSRFFVRLVFHELIKKQPNEDPAKFYLMDGNDFYSHGVKGVCLFTSMKLMNRNIMLPPAVIKKTNALNSIECPIHVPVEQPEKNEKIPDMVVFIGIESVNYLEII